MEDFVRERRFLVRIVDNSLHQLTMMLSSDTDPFVRIEAYYRDKGYYGPILEIWELLPRKTPGEVVLEDRLMVTQEAGGFGTAAKKFLLTLRSHAVMETVLTAAILISFFVINAVAHPR